MPYPHFKPTEKLKDKLKTVRTTSHSTYNINYHIVWIPKYRKPILHHERVKEVLEAILRGQSESREWTVLALEINPDHIHLFISVPPIWSPSEVVNILKGNTSRQLRLVFPFLRKVVKKHLWATGYYISTAGYVSQEQVRRYIEEQSKRLALHRMEKLNKKEVEELNKTDKTILDYLTSLPLKPKGMSIREAT